jgi:pimeloyl-ACP methyl ester carboxylesterase
MSTDAQSLSARSQLLAGIPVAEQRLDIGGISTAVLSGGSGPPLLLLHGPNENAAKWYAVLPDLLATHSVVAPDLPGHGHTIVHEGDVNVSRVLAWLDELIDRTCESPPTLVGHLLGGGIAARFAARFPRRAARLVLVDALGLVPLQPAPEFQRALMSFYERPAEDTYEALWDQCAFDKDGLRARMQETWDLLRSFTLDRMDDRALQSQAQSLLAAFGMTPMATEELAAITVPTTLVWGREDLATRLQVAETASARFGWPLHVIDRAGDDPPLEQPRAFTRALRAALTGAAITSAATL